MKLHLKVVHVHGTIVMAQEHDEDEWVVWSAWSQYRAEGR